MDLNGNWGHPLNDNISIIKLSLHCRPTSQKCILKRKGKEKAMMWMQMLNNLRFEFFTAIIFT